MRVADMKARELGNAERATRDFVHLAGPVINGYAFCDIEKQKTIAKDALKWTIDHPYTALLDPEIPALPGRPQGQLPHGLQPAHGRGWPRKRRTSTAMPNVESIKKQRRENGADVKYCWRS